MNKTISSLLLILLGIILYTFFVCNGNTPKYQSVILGTYCGECYNHCSIFLKVDNDSTKIDTSDSYFKTGSYSYFQNNSGFFQDEINQDEIIKLVNLLPDNIANYPNEIGCPDCRDQCGIFIKVDNKEIHLDPEEHPEEFSKFKKRIFEITNSLHREFF